MTSYTYLARLTNNQGAYLGTIAGNDVKEINRKLRANWSDPQNIAVDVYNESNECVASKPFGRKTIKA